MAKPVVHKRLLTTTEVHPKRGRSYMKQNYRQVLCYKPWSMVVADNDTVTPYDEDVTCPDCLAKLGGRRESNRDVMAQARRAEEYNRMSWMNSP
jgi:hypothetical protein